MSVEAKDTNLAQHKVEALVVTFTPRALAFYYAETLADASTLTVVVLETLTETDADC